MQDEKTPGQKTYVKIIIWIIIIVFILGIAVVPYLN